MDHYVSMLHCNMARSRSSARTLEIPRTSTTERISLITGPTRTRRRIANALGRPCARVVLNCFAARLRPLFNPFQRRETASWMLLLP
jgi:hypothetical protein